jgi:hypothetical protein
MEGPVGPLLGEARVFDDPVLKAKAQLQEKIEQNLDVIIKMYSRSRTPDALADTGWASLYTRTHPDSQRGAEASGAAGNSRSGGVRVYAARAVNRSRIFSPCLASSRMIWQMPLISSAPIAIPVGRTRTRSASISVTGNLSPVPGKRER